MTSGRAPQSTRLLDTGSSMAPQMPPWIQDYSATTPLIGTCMAMGLGRLQGVHSSELQLTEWLSFSLRPDICCLGRQHSRRPWNQKPEPACQSRWNRDLAQKQTALSCCFMLLGKTASRWAIVPRPLLRSCRQQEISSTLPASV